MTTGGIVSEERIGFVGLGNMGGRMARRIVDAGVPVAGFDVRADNIIDAGARALPNPGAVMSESDIVLLSLPDSSVVEAVVFGDDGLLAAAREGAIVVDLSTSSPESTRRIGRELAAKRVSFLDAGISGGAAAAQSGTLTLMVGGDEASLDRIRGTLDLFSSNIFYCGPSGSGHTVKILNNFLNAVSLSATAEMMIVAKKAGLDLSMVLDVVNVSSGVNFATQHRFPKIIHGDYLKGGLTNTLMLKDVTLYLEMVGQLGVPSLNAGGPVASFGLARALGYADEISNTVVDAIGDIAGGVRLHDRSSS
jgi:3-hydroxyisobutyrate dehydrogenase